DQVAGACFGLVDLVGGGLALQPEGGTQPGHGGADPAPDLGGAQDGQGEVDAGLPLRRFTEYVQAVADLGILDLAQPAVDVEQEVVELLVGGAFLQPEVAVQFRGAHERPDLGADRGEFGRVHRGDVGVLVHELFQACDVAVAFGAGHGRDEVVDDGGVYAALGLGTLARVVDQERVDERQV